MVTYEERQLMAIYNTGTRQGLLEELTEMQSYISAEGPRPITTRRSCSWTPASISRLPCPPGR